METEAKREAEIARALGKKHAGMPDDRVQRNFTDPDSQIMPAPGGKDFVQAYNAQVAVDTAHQVIVTCEVTNQIVDRGKAVPMIEQVRQNTGELPREMSADAGYFSKQAVKKLTALGVEAFIPPDKIKHTAPLASAPCGRIPQGMSLIDKMRRKMRTKRGKKCYAQRMKTVEPVLGQIKHALGFRQFLLRGLKKVTGEWRLICTVHNLMKLFRAKMEGLVKQEIWAWA